MSATDDEHRYQHEAERLRRALEAAADCFEALEEGAEHQGDDQAEDVDEGMCDDGPDDCRRCHAHVAGKAARDALAGE